MKRIIGIFAVLIVAAIIGTLVFCPAQPGENAKIGYPFGSLNHAPIIIAYENGFFAEHGLEVELVPLKSGTDVTQAVSTGTIDFGSASYPIFFVPISKGAPVKIVAPSTLSPTFLFVRPDSNIETLKDLEGKSIRSGARGTVTNIELRYLFAKEGIDMNSITFVDIESSYTPIALMEKKIIDAASAIESKEITYRKAGAVVLKEWIEKNYSGEPRLNTVVAANTEFMAKHPEMAEAFIDSFIEGHAFIRSNPEQAAEIVAKHIGTNTKNAARLTPEDVEMAWSNMQYALWHDPEKLVEMAKISREVGDIDKDLALDQLFDTRFESKLKEAQEKIYEPEN